MLEVSECTFCPFTSQNGPLSRLKLLYEPPVLRRGKVGLPLAGLSGEVGVFEVNDISRFPLDGTSLDPPYADPNFQPRRELRLLMRELLYSLQRGKLKMRWLRTKI